MRNLRAVGIFGDLIKFCNPDLVFFPKFQVKVKKQKEVLSNLVNRSYEEGVKGYLEEKNEARRFVEHEKLYWKQRVEAFRMTEGDTNSKFFHAAATKRKKINHLTQLVYSDNEVVDSHDEMCKVAVEFFKSIF